MPMRLYNSTVKAEVKRGSLSEAELQSSCSCNIDAKHKYRLSNGVHHVGTCSVYRLSARVRLRAHLDCMEGLPRHDMLPLSATPVLTAMHCLGMQGSRSTRQLTRRVWRQLPAWLDMLPTPETPVLTVLHCLGLQGSRSLQQLHPMSLAAAACACSTSWQQQRLRLKPWLGQCPPRCLCWWQPWAGEWQVIGEPAI